MWLRSRLDKVRRKVVRENRIYIIPSGRGIMFLAMFVVLVLTAATYNNNLIFILAFQLFAAFSLAMIQTHYNMKGVSLEFVSSEENFEGQSYAVLFRLVQKRARLKKDLRVRTLSKKFRTISENREEITPAELTKSVRIDVIANTWGVHPIPEVVLETYFPLGMFRAWKVFRPEGNFIVYPRPEGDAPLLSSLQETGESELGLRSSPEGDFGELKEYRVGESYHQISWKHFARTQKLYSRVHWGEDHKHFVIPWLEGERERSLRQMSRWIQSAFEEGASFELETPSLKLDRGEGIEHARHCWRALAHFKRAE